MGGARKGRGAYVSCMIQVVGARAGSQVHLPGGLAFGLEHTDHGDAELVKVLGIGAVVAGPGAFRWLAHLLGHPGGWEAV